MNTRNEVKSVIYSKGVKATTLEETMCVAGFDWEVKEEKIRYSGGTLPLKKILTRSDTGEALGIVGDEYKATEPRKFIQEQFRLAESLGGRVIRAGWVGRRSKAFSVIRLNEQLTIPSNLREVGDNVGLFVYSTESWDGGSPRMSSLYLERLICKNGAKTQELSAGMSVAHTKNSEVRYRPALRLFVNEVEDKSELAKNQFVKLAETRMSKTEVESFLEKLIPGETTTAENKRTEIIGLFSQGVGNFGRTRWDAFNAVTEWVTHHAPYRETRIASADTSRFLGVLERNTTNERALNLLLN